MDDKFLNKFINKFKDKFTKSKQTYPNNYEYAFSTEEIENINKQNKQKIQELKQDIFTKKKDIQKPNTEEVLSKIETNQEEVKITKEENQDSDTNELEEKIESKESLEEETIKKEDLPLPKNSFINLNDDHQKLIMDKWNEIKPNKIDKDIIDGKDLLNHNYTITYADDAAKFIHHIRKEYEIVICYLIGFNNEKQGIYDKTIFSNKIDEEWKHLNSYIKILEKIRNFKK